MDLTHEERSSHSCLPHVLFTFRNVESYFHSFSDTDVTNFEFPANTVNGGIFTATNLHKHECTAWIRKCVNWSTHHFKAEGIPAISESKPANPKWSMTANGDFLPDPWFAWDPEECNLKKLKFLMRLYQQKMSCVWNQKPKKKITPAKKKSYHSYSLIKPPRFLSHKQPRYHPRLCSYQTEPTVLRTHSSCWERSKGLFAFLWRSLHATPVFYMKNDPRFGGRESWYFLKMYLVIDHRDTKRISSLGSHSVEALSPKKSICAQKAINFSTPTKIVVAARQSVKSQLHVGKQPTKNQAVKIGQRRNWPYQTPKRDVRATTWKKDSKESRPPVWILWTKFANFIQKKNLKGYLAKKMSGQDNN